MGQQSAEIHARKFMTLRLGALNVRGTCSCPAPHRIALRFPRAGYLIGTHRHFAGDFAG
jgi:hypothetical protein